MHCTRADWRSVVYFSCKHATTRETNGTHTMLFSFFSSKEFSSSVVRNVRHTRRKLSSLWKPFLQQPYNIQWSSFNVFRYQVLVENLYWTCSLRSRTKLWFCTFLINYILLQWWAVILVNPFQFFMEGVVVEGSVAIPMESACR